MGAGILPTCIYKGKLYFLFGKENKYNDTPGFSDFGGGTDNNESHIQTAIREGTEELTGFLGSKAELSKMLSRAFYIDFPHSYRTFIFKYNYNPFLEIYYNNNQKFLQKKLSPSLIKSSKIFEKSEIRWFCIDELAKSKRLFRSFFRDLNIDILIAKKTEIYNYIASQR
jgi:8-oxo-dGTP pyrophosphatase MutT (NUDIX family)